MPQRFKTIKGFFGQLIHYKDSIKVVESWPSLFKGSYTHYDANGSYVGCSNPGLFGSQVHLNEFGSKIGETWTNSFGISRHYSDDQGYIGSSHDGVFSRTANIDTLSDTLFSSQAASPFDGDIFDDFAADSSFGDSDW